MDNTSYDKIEKLKDIYIEFAMLASSEFYGISFSRLYINDNLGWDTFIKYFFLKKGIADGNMIITELQKRDSSKKYIQNYRKMIDEVKKKAFHIYTDIKKNNPDEIYYHKKTKESSEYIVDLCWINKDNNMVLGVELEQSREREAIREKDILFDFYKLLYLNCELKIMIANPWQQQRDNLINKMDNLITKIDNYNNHNYLIIFISEDITRGRIKRRETINYQISGFILPGKIKLDTITCECLWKNS